MAALKDTESGQDNLGGTKQSPATVESTPKRGPAPTDEIKSVRKKNGAKRGSASSELSEDERAAEKKWADELDRIYYETTKFVVPMWFGQTDVRKAFRNQLCAESALCLMLIGAMESRGQASIVFMEMKLMRSGFDQEERWLLAHMGTMSLIGAKLAKFAKEPENNDAIRSAKLILTKKGRDRYELVKNSMLRPYGENTRHSLP